MIGAHQFCVCPVRAGTALPSDYIVHIPHEQTMVFCITTNGFRCCRCTWIDGIRASTPSLPGLGIYFFILQIIIYYVTLTNLDKILNNKQVNNKKTSCKTNFAGGSIISSLIRLFSLFFIFFHRGFRRCRSSFYRLVNFYIFS